jgi:transposase
VVPAGPGPGRGGCCAARAYSGSAIRAHLRGRGIRASILVPADQVRGRQRRGGRPPAFGPAASKQRNVAGRAFCYLRQYRAVATRYDKRDVVWRGTTDVASVRVWLRRPSQDLGDTL